MGSVTLGFNAVHICTGVGLQQVAEKLEHLPGDLSQNARPGTRKSRWYAK